LIGVEGSGESRQTFGTKGGHQPSVLVFSRPSVLLVRLCTSSAVSPAAVHHHDISPSGSKRRSSHPSFSEVMRMRISPVRENLTPVRPQHPRVDQNLLLRVS
jgi:hypothetical protein